MMMRKTYLLNNLVHEGIVAGGGTAISIFHEAVGDRVGQICQRLLEYINTEPVK